MPMGRDVKETHPFLSNVGIRSVQGQEPTGIMTDTEQAVHYIYLYTTTIDAK